MHTEKIQTDNSRPTFFQAIQLLKTLTNFFRTSPLFIILAYSFLRLASIHRAAGKYNRTQEAANKSPFNAGSHHLQHMPELPRDCG